MAKSVDAFRTISEVADDLDIPKHVLRFWEVKFAQIRPMKRGGGRRYYRPEDLELLKGIQHLLHRDGYTIKGVQKILREQGVEAVKTHAGIGVASSAQAVSGPAGAASSPAAAPSPENAARGDRMRGLLPGQRSPKGRSPTKSATPDTDPARQIAGEPVATATAVRRNRASGSR